jgi:ketosteroid isomerase-like protein
MSEEKVQLAREAVKAWNRRDADWLIANSVPDVEFIPAVAGGVEGQGRVVHRADGFRDFFSDLDETWERFEIEPEEFREVGEAVISICHVHARGRASGLELDQPIAMVSWFRDGKFARARSFLDVGEALEAAKQEVAA